MLIEFLNPKQCNLTLCCGALKKILVGTGPVGGRSIIISLST